MIQSLTDGPFCTRVTEPRIQILFVSAIHEVLVAERGFIVSLNVRVQHVNVSIEIDWADTTGAHEKVFCIVCRGHILCNIIAFNQRGTF